MSEKFRDKPPIGIQIRNKDLTRVISVKPVFIVLNLFLLLILLASCSSERNSLTSKAFHNTTAHYNGYYYAREEIRQIEQTLWSSLVDDYNKILRLYPGLDSALATSYDKEIQEAIKMASIAIQLHPNSKWVDDSYLLVGKARLYSLDWGNAIASFKYVNKIGKDEPTRHKAIINLIRTFTEYSEFNNAQAAIDYLEKEKLTKTNKKNLLLEKAYLYQVQGNYDYMVRNLTKVEDYLKKKDKPGRIYFIIGQVYQKLGFESEAYNYYKKCISTTPDYEIDFYARLYMAQVTEISRSRSVNAARKSFRKLLKDSKNKEFKDKIYYEMGVFELKQKNIQGAIAEFNKSIRAGNNKLIDGESYLRLGEIYYDTLRKYELSQAYYDSAIQALPRDYERYDQIKNRQEVLNEFVKNLNTIKWQDSLLLMASLDSAALYTRIDSAFEARKKLEEKNRPKKKRRANRIDIVSNTNNVFGSGDGQPLQFGSDESSDWYFSNPTAMSIGQTEFRRIWGDIPLADNWRRSLSSSAGGAGRRTAAASAQAQGNKTNEEAAPPPNLVAAEFHRVNALVPRTDEQRHEALKKIEDAYFSLGDIYYFKLTEKDNAASSYQTLLRRFPQSEYEPEVLYRLYLIYKEDDGIRSEEYAALLKNKHPNSTFAKILINPNYLEEAHQTIEKQQALYKTAYENFESRKYQAAQKIIADAIALGQTSFVPNLELLKIMIVGRTDDINQYQYQLDDFIKRNAETPSGAYAKKLLDASRQFQKNREKQKGIKYISSLEEPHYFVLVYKKDQNMGNIPSSSMERFNQNFFNQLKLKTSNLVLNDDYIITLVADFPDMRSAVDYVKTFNEKLSTLTALRNHKFNNFVITKDNFDIFYRTKGLDEYLNFFEKNYPVEIE